MDHSYPLLDAQEEAEAALKSANIAALGETYVYLSYLQETLLIAFRNAGKPLEVPNDKNSPAIFVMVATTRAFAIAKTAMDQSLRGYPIVGLAVSRFLSELVQSTQYLVRHPALIDPYLSGTIKLDRVLKMAADEPSKTPAVFGQFWGLQSRFSHAGQDFLVLGVETNSNKMKAQLLYYNREILSDVTYAILGSLLIQYLTFRVVLKDHLQVEGELRSRDAFLFLPANVRQHIGLSSIPDGFLQEAYDWFNPPNMAQAPPGEQASL
jgi:hypothetical protein